MTLAMSREAIGVVLERWMRGGRVSETQVKAAVGQLLTEGRTQCQYCLKKDQQIDALKEHQRAMGQQLAERSDKYSGTGKDRDSDRFLSKAANGLSHIIGCEPVRRHFPEFVVEYMFIVRDEINGERTRRAQLEKEAA